MYLSYLFKIEFLYPYIYIYIIVLYRSIDLYYIYTYISATILSITLRRTRLVCDDSIDGFNVVMILGEEVLGKLALCTYVVSVRHSFKSSVHEASYSTAHESILTATNICRECPGVHNNGAFKPIHVGLQEILDHSQATILVTTSARSLDSTRIVLQGFGSWVR